MIGSAQWSRFQIKKKGGGEGGGGGEIKERVTEVFFSIKTKTRQRGREMNVDGCGLSQTGRLMMGWVSMRCIFPKSPLDFV